MDLIKSGRYIDIFLYQNMHNNKNKQCGGVSCSACNAFIDNCGNKIQHQTSLIQKACINVGVTKCDIIKYVISACLHENDVTFLVQASQYNKIWTGLKAALSQ